MFTISPRTLWMETSKEGVLNATDLNDVLLHLQRMAKNQQPVDFHRPLSDLVVKFSNGRMWCHWKDAPNEHMLVMDHGASQLSSQVLPPRFFSGLKVLASYDEEGSRIASDAWAKLASKKRKTVCVRTQNICLNKIVHRVVRACVSTEYAKYSYIQFVEDILTHAEEFARLPILDWCITDTGIRIRFVGMDSVTAAFAPMDKTILDNTTIPVIDLWNSEVGLRTVGMHGGSWRLRCASGVGHWDKSLEQSWIHRGRTERIREELLGAFETTRALAQDVAAAFSEAETIEVEDPHAWLDDVCRGHLTKEQIEECKKNLNDPRVSKNSTLATVVDAVSLMAKRRAPAPLGTPVGKDDPERDWDAQSKLEVVAAVVMHRGRMIAAKHGRIAA